MYAVGLEGEVVEREGREEELHHALSQLDREHDALRREADLKDEQIEQLRSNLQHKVHSLYIQCTRECIRQYPGLISVFNLVHVHVCKVNTSGGHS